MIGGRVMECGFVSDSTDDVVFLFGQETNKYHAVEIVLL